MVAANADGADAKTNAHTSRPPASADSRRAVATRGVADTGLAGALGTPCRPAMTLTMELTSTLGVRRGRGIMLSLHKFCVPAADGRDGGCAWG